MHNVIKLNEKIHQFEIQTIKLIMMIYFEIVQLMISKIFELDFDDENFDNENIANETFVVESSTINDETIISSKFNEKIFDFQIVNFFE